MFKNVPFLFAVTVGLIFTLGTMLMADDQIMIPSSEMNVSSPTPVQAIVVDPNGNVTEQEYTYDPNTQVIIINNNTGGDNASIFFPVLAMGFIWWNGYWVDHDGYYYSNNRWVHVDNDDWNGHWHNYWHNHWDNHWHNHWNNHNRNPNFRYQKQEHWRDNSFSRGRGAPGRAREGGGGGHGGGHGGHGGGHR